MKDRLSSVETGVIYDVGVYLNLSFLLPDTVTLDTWLNTQNYIYC